jgi:glycosyltransferase involved in cell wall biosynthesis
MELNGPLVSILIPCYNNEQFVGEAIDSALAQSYQNIEVIVVDDGSSDGSLEVIKSYSNRIRWHAGLNRGACAARNTAFKLSKGDFIQFLDADDILLPEKIKKQMPALLSGSADVVVCKGTLFGDGRPERPIKKPTPDPTGIDPVEYVLKYPIGTERPLYRRSFVGKVQGYRESLPRAQDWDFNVRVAAAGARFSLVDEILVRHRHHDSPTRITKQKLPFDYTIKVCLEISALLKDEPYRLSVKACRVFARELNQLSIYAYRNGCRDIAKCGFYEAKKWCPNAGVQERWAYQILNLFIPLMFLESLLKCGRKIRGFVKKYQKLIWVAD